jgi:hypothetical protein
VDYEEVCSSLMAARACVIAVTGNIPTRLIVAFGIELESNKTNTCLSLDDKEVKGAS